MKKIIVPTDFSETATNAIFYTLDLFKYEYIEMTLVHAFADEVYENTTKMSRDYFEEYKNNVEKNVDGRLQKEVANILEKSCNPKHVYHRVSIFGSVIDAVNELVDKQNADMVIMGSKGESNDPALVFGSHAIQVIKYVKCPVLAVPATFHDRLLKEILFPTDFMMPYKHRELKLLSNIASHYDATIHFLYVSKSKHFSHRQVDNRMFLEASVDDNNFTFLQMQEEELTATINQIILEKKIELLVMVNYRQSYTEHLLYHSTIEKIGLEIKIPFFVLQNLPRE